MDYGYPRLYSSLPIPHCANSVLCLHCAKCPKFGSYDYALVVTCGLTKFTRIFHCTQRIPGEEPISILPNEWFSVYGAKQINSNDDV